MRRVMAMAAAAALVGATAVVPAPALADPAAAPGAAPQFLRPAQFFGPGPHHGGHGVAARGWRGYGPAYGYGPHRVW